MSSPRITYTPHHDVSPEGEISALANVYAFILQKQHQEKQKGTRPGAPDDGTKVKEDSADAPIILE